MKQLIIQFISKGEKLSLRLLFWILLFSSVFAVMATAVQLYTDYRDSRQSLELSLNKIENSVLPSIAVATWKLDKEMMESILTGLLTQSGIVHVEILDTYSSTVTSVGQQEYENSFVRIYPIKFKNNETGQQSVIGQLEITATLSEIYRELISKTVVILLTQGLKTFFMAICILILVDRLVIRHLNSLIRWAKEVDLSNPDQLLELNRNKATKGDAIDNVINAINTMQTNLIRALAEREQTEKLIYSIVDNTPSLIYAKDKDGRYTLVNQEYLSVFGLSQNEVIGQTASDLFPKSISAMLKDHDHLVTRQREAITFDEEIPLNDQPQIYMSVKFPIYDECNNLIGDRWSLHKYY